MVLVWLGVRGLLALRHPAAQLAHAPAQANSRHADFVTGLAVNLGNPKAGVFAIALLPQFVPAHAPQFWAMAGLGALWAAVTMTWYVLFIQLAERGRALLARPRPRAILTGVSSLSLVGIGVGSQPASDRAGRLSMSEIAVLTALSLIDNRAQARIVPISPR